MSNTIFDCVQAPMLGVLLEVQDCILVGFEGVELATLLHFPHNNNVQFWQPCFFFWSFDSFSGSATVMT